MASVKEGQYTLLREDIGLEQNIDPVCSSRGNGYLTDTRMQNVLNDNVLRWIRYGIIIGLQIVIIVLLPLRTGKLDRLVRTLEEVETGSDINGLYRTCK